MNLFILFAFGSMLQNFAPFSMDIRYYGSRGSLTRDASGGLLLQVRYERFYNSFCTITLSIMNNITHWYVTVAFSTRLQNGVPICMDVPYGGANPEGNVVSTLNMLSNSNSNDQTLRQVSWSSDMVILGFTWYCSTCNIFLF